MQDNEGIMSLFPGSVATNSVVLVLGIILVLCSLLPGTSGKAASILTGLGSAMFLAGFLGLIHARALAKEVHKVVSLPFEETMLLTQLHWAGIEWISRERADFGEKIISALEKEINEIVIVGSSLKGLIGVGYNAVGQAQRIREALINALKRGTQLNILMTNPKIAHHRSKQEGRVNGDIEAEILENLMYLIRLKHNNPNIAPKLKIGLYDGTPTIFMLCTSNLMMINPYPYYSTAYSSFSFLIKGGSALYRGYYQSHYREAWTDTKMTLYISENIDLAMEQIKDLIEGTNPLGKKIIPDAAKEKALLEEWNKLKTLIENE